MDPKVKFPQGAKEEAFVMSSTEQAAVQGNSFNIDMCAINVLAPFSVEHAQPTTRNTKNIMMTKENQATNPPDQNETDVPPLPAPICVKRQLTFCLATQTLPLFMSSVAFLDKVHA